MRTDQALNMFRVSFFLSRTYSRNGRLARLCVWQALVSGFLLATSTLRAEIVPWPLTALDLAEQRTVAMQCVSQLKQTVLAARLWALEYEGRGPRDIAEFTN